MTKLPTIHSQLDDLLDELQSSDDLVFTTPQIDLLEKRFFESKESLAEDTSRAEPGSSTPKNLRVVRLQQVAYHRNGISGAPFHAVLFVDPSQGPMLGVVFDQPHHVAVFQLDKLSRGDITFGSNSWRGDHYEPQLRKMIATATEVPL